MTAQYDDIGLGLLGPAGPSEGRVLGPSPAGGSSHHPAPSPGQRPGGPSRQTYILISIQDGEPVLVQPYYTLGDAAAVFRAIIDEEPDYAESDIGRTRFLLLDRVVAKAMNWNGDTLWIVERAV